MSGNGHRQPSRPRIEFGGGPGAIASPEEAAAIAAAIEQFLRDTAPPPTAAPSIDPWLRAGLFEGTGRYPGAPSPWGDPVRWGNPRGV